MRVTIFEVVEVATVEVPIDSLEPQRVVLPPAAINTVASELGSVLSSIDGHLRRIADALAPVTENAVGTEYVARRLGFKSTQRITQLIDEGVIPAECILPRLGEGGRWRFDRGKIDRWIEDYRREKP